MSHHIYHTEGFVLASHSAQEANKMLYIFTKELGVVHASAQGIRLLRSKLRYSLQDFAYVNISLVRGKDIWRVTNASPVVTRFPNIFSQPDYFAIYVKILTLLKRLLNGEEKNESLFELLINAFDFLETTTAKNFQPLSFECMLVLQILHNLGYGSPHSAFEEYGSPVIWSGEHITSFEPHRSRALAEINTSLRESHL
ncbi:DNA repair protein RecO, partial [Patescibacteria group bacterium]